MIRVGLVDNGIAPALAGSVAAARAFAGAALIEDARGHGTTVAGIVLNYAPGARLLNAQAFGSGARTNAAAVADALRWLIAERARLVNLSLGLPHDREVLRAAVADALAAGLILVAATPARGPPVYPAAYQGVLRVTGDARCAPGELSALGGVPADYGACPRDLDQTPGGASLAAAHVTGLLARGLKTAGTDPVALLSRAVRYHGRERRQPRG
ncbi:MAG TPA: S8 family serine peptidase [Geminicoccaceae bacterium]|nr:S8 family serine peptidase [Geminicoccaceae bacterium]